jgi:hypothetical protein
VGDAIVQCAHGTLYMILLTHNWQTLLRKEPCNYFKGARKQQRKFTRFGIAENVDNAHWVGYFITVGSGGQVHASLMDSLSRNRDGIVYSPRHKKFFFQFFEILQDEWNRYGEGGILKTKPIGLTMSETREGVPHTLNLTCPRIHGTTVEHEIEHEIVLQHPSPQQMKSCYNKTATVVACGR